MSTTSTPMQPRTKPLTDSQALTPPHLQVPMPLASPGLGSVTMEVIGCNAGSPQASGAASGYLARIGDTTILVDCGPGVVMELARTGRLADLDAVIVTHEHFDHCGDLMALAYHRAFPVRQRPLPLFAPKSLRKTLDALDAVFGIPTLDELRSPLHTQLPFHEVEIGRSFSVGSVRVDTLAAAHPVPTMSLRFPDLDLVYTADTALTPELIVFGREKILLAEATYVTGENRDFGQHGHMSGVEAGRLAREAEAAMLVLTHFSEPDDGVVTLARSAEQYSGLITRCSPGMLLPVGTPSSSGRGVA